MPTISDYNFETPFVDKQGRLTTVSTTWLFGPASGDALALVQALQSSIYRPCNPVVVAPAASGTIPTTSFPLSTLPGGQYRVSWFMQVITPDGGGSTATVTIGFTASGQALSVPGAAMNGDTVLTFQTPTTGVLDVDAGAPITWSVAYNSIGTPNKMKYRLVLVLEKLSS